VFLICMLFGAMSAYQTIISQFLLSVSEKAGIMPGYYSHETYRILFTIGVTVFILIPLSLAKNITSLRYLTIICVISIIYVTLLVVIQTPLYMTTMHNSIYDITLFKLDYSIADTISIIVFAFNAVTSVPVIYSELYMSNYRRMTKVINRSVVLSGFMYIILGSFGYLSYCSNMPGLVTNRGSVEGPDVIDWPMEIAKVLIACALCGTIAIANNSLRISVEQMIAGTEPEENEGRYWTINFSIVIGIMVVAIVFPDAVSYFKLLGGIFGVPMSIILPSNIYTAVIYWTISKNYPLLTIVTLWSSFISVLGVFSVIKSFL
jgi:amino acid permease